MIPEILWILWSILVCVGAFVIREAKKAHDAERRHRENQLHEQHCARVGKADADAINEGR